MRPMGPMGNYIFGVTHYSHWSYRSHKSHFYADSWVSFSNLTIKQSAQKRSENFLAPNFAF